MKHKQTCKKTFAFQKKNPCGTFVRCNTKEKHSLNITVIFS